MLIGIDGNEANAVNKVGDQQYAYELLSTFYRVRSTGKSKHTFVIYLKDLPNRTLPNENTFWKYKVIKGNRLWIVTKLLPELFRDPKVDVFFTPTHYLPPICPVKSVFTIHDLGYLNFSGQFKRYDFWQLKYWTAISIIISKYIIAVSNFTKQDIVRHYPFASKKVTVVHHGYNKFLYNFKKEENLVRRVKQIFNLPNNYILYLGTLKPSKNIEGIIDAFNYLLKFDANQTKLKLVIAGKKGWLFQNIFNKVRQLKISNNVLFTDYISESDKINLLKGARFLISPSFWEGFGMHILEAIASGTPVVASKVASIPEVLGKAGVYVDPYNINNIAKGMQKVLYMSEIEYNNLRKKCLSQAQKFSWEKCALETLKVLESV